MHLLKPTAKEERHSTINHGMVSEELQMQRITDTHLIQTKEPPAWDLRKGPGFTGIIGAFGPSSTITRKVGGSYKLL